MPDILYIDIETTANEGMRKFIPQPIPPAADEAPPGSQTSAKKTATWLVQEQMRRDKKYASAVEGMAVDVDYARVLAIGWEGDDGDWGVWYSFDNKTEIHNFIAFWDLLFKYRRLCGWNILRFDLPIILRRSWALGIQPTRTLNLNRYSTTEIDLMEIFYHCGQAPGPRYRKLSEVAAMYGIPDEHPDLDGSMVAEMDEPTLISYCRNHVRMTRELAERTRGWYWQ